MTTSGSFTFDYEGKPSKISLPQGQYVLKIWGAKGGDGNATGLSNQQRLNSIVPGGLGGYSRDILNFEKKRRRYKFSSEKKVKHRIQSQNIVFPDGGGAKTGVYSGCTTVPGTDDGSTSIRIVNETDYARVIVALIISINVGLEEVKAAAIAITKDHFRNMVQAFKQAAHAELAI